MFDLHEDVRQEDGRRQMFGQGERIETEVVVLRDSADQKKVRQLLLGDETLEVAEVGVADAGGPAVHAEESCDLTRLAVLMDPEQLPDGQRQGQTLAARGVLETPFELVLVQRGRFAGVQPQPADGQEREGLGVVLREVGKIEFHPRISQRDLLSVRADDLAGLRQAARRKLPAMAGLHFAVAPDDVEKCLQAGLHACVGGVGVDLKDQVRLRPQLGREHGVRERVDGAAEIADAKEEQVRVLPGEGHGIHDLVRKVPGSGTAADRHEAVGGDHRDAHAGELPAHGLRGFRGECIVAVAA